MPRAKERSGLAGCGLGHQLVLGATKRFAGKPKGSEAPRSVTPIVKKKLEDRSFAAKVDRAEVYAGPERLGTSLDEYIQLVIEAQVPHAKALGIEGSSRPAGAKPRVNRSMQNWACALRSTAWGLTRLPGGSIMPPEVTRRLLEDDPPIVILAEGERTLRIAAWTLQGDEHELVAGRLHALFLVITYLAKRQSSRRDGTVSWSLSAVARSQEGSASFR